MKRMTLPHPIYSLLFVGLLAGQTPAKEDVEPAISPVDEPIVLFNGKDLTGFYTWLSDTKYEDPRKVFTVTKESDGTPVIRVSGDGYGTLATKQRYKNYHLIVEYRWGELTWGNRKKATKDSGILLHGHGDDGNHGSGQGQSPWMASIEFQIIEGGVGDLLVLSGTNNDGSPCISSLTCEISKDRDGETVWKKGGERKSFTGGRINWYGRDPDWEDVIGFRGKEDIESPGQEWTRLECICDGGNITNIVNGTVVNEGTMAEPSAGKLLFQTEEAEIYFRKIELHPLKK